MSLLQRNDIHTGRRLIVTSPPTRFGRVPMPHISHYPQSNNERWTFPVASQERARTGKNFNVPFVAALKRALQEFPAIAMDPEVIAGTPRMSGTRIPVHLVIEAVKYYGVEGAVESFPDLTVDLVKEALSFAARVLEHPVDYETETAAG